VNDGPWTAAICSLYEHTVIYRTTSHDNRRVRETMSSKASPRPGNTRRPATLLDGYVKDMKIDVPMSANMLLRVPAQGFGPFFCSECP
jgi:hypothetical protein